MFARGGDNTLRHRWYDGFTWHPWENLGGELTSAPAVESRAPGHLDVFMRGADGALHTRSGETWLDKPSLGGELPVSSPAAVSWGPATSTYSFAA